MSPAELLLELLPAVLAGVASFAGTWAAVRMQLRFLAREVTRAHKRLDLIRAPNVTLDSVMDL